MRSLLTKEVDELHRGRGDGHEIAKLVEALDRLEKGAYGICTECGEAIGDERLLESPTVTLCPTCASADSWRPFAPG
ncbi:MAG TPA: TraR/DksA C4-type zinc finger protein [Kofleriaceae bacterium]|nr:TraR/DksA C4-type zinc finger protein [Kofleriaceae bacterium]